jgi:polar amino acid transport system substrate-binding protein
MRPPLRLGRNVIAAATASTALLYWPGGSAQIASAAAAQSAAATRAAQVMAPAKSSAAPACDPTASLQPPPGPPTVTPGSFMAAIRERGYLIAGVDLNTYLLGYLNPSNVKPEGFDIDMVHAIAAAIFGNPDQIKFVATTDDQRSPFVQSGRVDIVAHSMTVTCKRWRSVDFSTVYLDAHQRILVEDGSPIQGVDDLFGLKVCATGTTTTSAAYLRQHHAVVVGAYDWTDCLVKLQQGDVAAISTDDSILAGLKAQDPYTEIVGPQLEDEPYGLAISKQHPDLVRFVNAVLDQMRADGQWAAIYERWIGSPAPAPPPAHYQG